MKFNIFKYIFIIFVIILVIISVYIVNKQQEESNNTVFTDNIPNYVRIVPNINLAIVQYDTINPIQSNNKNVQEISKLVYEPLLDLTTEYKIVNKIAKECSKINQNTYIIKLNENKKWHDGTNVNANDIRYTIETIKQQGEKSIYNNNVKNISKIEIIDDYTLKIELSNEIPFFEYYLTFPIVNKNNILLGTGQYKISLLEENKITLTLSNDNNESKINKIEINLYNSMGEVYNDFKIGNIDIITTSNIEYEEYVGKIGYNVKQVRGRLYDSILINLASDILSNKEVRQALKYGIDRNSLIAVFYNNKYNKIEFPLQYGSYLSSAEEINDYDKEKARSILLENGWIFKDNVWQKQSEGKVKYLELSIAIKQDDKEKLKIIENIKNQLEIIGIKLNIVQISNKEYNDIENNKKYDMLFSSELLSITPDISRYFDENGFINYNNEEINTILNEVKSIKDERLLKEKYNIIEQVFKDDIVHIPLYISSYNVLYNTRLMGDISPNFYNIFYNIEGWYKEDN